MENIFFGPKKVSVFIKGSYAKNGAIVLACIILS